MTAEEFLEHISENGKYTFDWQEFGILFAKYHVEQALKAASENATQQTIIGGYGDPNKSNKIVINKSSILNAYPLEKIK
jgi:hypothetical protein